MSNSFQHRALLAMATTVLAVCGASSGALGDESDTVGVSVPKGEEAYPDQLNLRPLTLPQGMIQTGIGGGYSWIDGQSNIAPVSMSTRVGITDWWDASAYTYFRLKPDAEWRETVSLSTKILAYDSGRIDFAPGVYVPINFNQADDAHLLPGIALDATTRVHIRKHIPRAKEGLSRPTSMSVVFGQGLVPLSIGRRASLNFNVSLLIQMGPSVGMRISSQLLHVRLNGDVRKTVLFERPVYISVFRSIGNWIDFTVTYSPGPSGVFGGIADRH